MFAAKMGIFGKHNFFQSTFFCKSSCFMRFLSHIGFWTGLLICVFLQSIFFIVFLIKLDWVKATEEVRAQKKIFYLHLLYPYYISYINTLPLLQAQIRAGVLLNCTEDGKHLSHK